ncbi:MAG TPA: hypothetical protein VH186_36035 [Chloroflexia bacterium]|nr:hypothetical protein [Chloroflexia bacterium]
MSAFVFDTHSRLVERVVEDLSREIAVIRVSEWYRRLRGRGCDPVRELSGLSSSKARARVEELAPPEENYAKAKVYWPDRAEVMEQMLVVLNLSDRRQPPGLNLLDASMWESKENCAGVLIEIFKGIWPETWGVRMEDCLRHAIYALFLLNSQRFPESQFTILDVIDFINNDHLRRELLKHPLIADANPRVASWWNDQFERMSESFRVEVTKPVLNKLNPLAGSSLLSNIFGQPRTTIDFKKLLVSGVVVLVDLAGTEIEMENAALAGAILMGVLLRQVKAVASALPEEAVPLSVLVVDEFTTIISAPYSDILSQYRKWGIRAFLATQSLVLCDRLDPVLRPLIMATADNLWILQANAEDAQFLRRELVSDHTTVAGSSAQSQAGSLVNPLAGGGGVGPDVYALVNARRGLCFLKATIKGVRRPVFSLEISSRLFQNFSKYTTSPELAALIEQEFQATRKRIVERSREIYGRSSLEASLYVNRMSEDYSCIARGYISDKENSPVINGFIDPEWQQRLSGLLVNYVEEPLREAEKRRQRAAERHFLKQQKKSQPS